jgi:putative spermidine/putrescine transport system ATP-binding protein
VYERPRSRFVADFVGSSNVMSPAFSSAHGGPSAWTSLRPEKIGVLKSSEAPRADLGSAEGRIVALHYQGAVTRIVIAAGDTRLTAATPAGATQFAEGETVRFVWSRDSLVAMEPQ